MRWILPSLLACGFIVFSFQPGLTQDKKKEKKGKFAPPANLQPTAEVLQQIQTKTEQLAAEIAALRKRGDKKIDAFLPDVEIYHRGAVNIVRFKEFYNKDSAKWTLAELDVGIDRAKKLAKDQTPWTTLEKRNAARAFRSEIDGSAQPYGVTYPLEYGKDPKRKWRVDIVLHGRNSTLTEISFLRSHNGTKKVAADQDWVQIDIFGRGNNAYRWSGETDVFEAMKHFFATEAMQGRRGLVSRDRVVLRGFSMGGAGTWHLGLHHPGTWCVMGPGAGFTTTHGYAWKEKKALPDYQEKCLRIYDAIDYVENTRMIPIVAYSGGDDPQKLAADNIENRLKELKIPGMTHLVKPGVGHKFDADYFVKANALWSQHAAKGRDRNPVKVEFMTYTLKFPACDWVTILGLDEHYKKATVTAERSDTGYRVKTQNVRRLRLDHFGLTNPNVMCVIDVDGQILQHTTRNVRLVREKGKWQLDSAEAKRGLEKALGLQGPIDDAFEFSFVCVAGTGKPWHAATQKFADAKLKAFEYDWAKHWRGELPVTNEYGITPNEIKNKHLILFGDPGSNFLLANLLPKLPLKWTKDEIEFGGKKYKASEHVPVMIFPNPDNPSKYVVLNTGHTIPSEDYTKTNAMLYPRLGDYAILRLTPTAKNAAAYEVATAGLFDEFWRVSEK